MLRFVQRTLVAFNFLVKVWNDEFIVNQRKSILRNKPNLHVLQLELSKRSSVLFFVRLDLCYKRFLLMS